LLVLRLHAIVPSFNKQVKVQQGSDKRRMQCIDRRSSCQGISRVVSRGVQKEFRRQPPMEVPELGAR
jgi:hypothetical protein